MSPELARLFAQLDMTAYRPWRKPRIERAKGEHPSSKQSRRSPAARRRKPRPATPRASATTRSAWPAGGGGCRSWSATLISSTRTFNQYSSWLLQRWLVSAMRTHRPGQVSLESGGVMRRSATLCIVAFALCFGGCMGCGSALWFNRVAYFRWSVPVGGGYNLVLRHGHMYAGPRYGNCTPPPTECEIYPIDHRTLSLHYTIASSEYPLLTIPLPIR